jgi:hypothetical protein
MRNSNQRHENVESLTLNYLSIKLSTNAYRYQSEIGQAPKIRASMPNLTGACTNMFEALLKAQNSKYSKPLLRKKEEYEANHPSRTSVLSAIAPQIGNIPLLAAFCTVAVTTLIFRLGTFEAGTSV